MVCYIYTCTTRYTLSFTIILAILTPPSLLLEAQSVLRVGMMGYVVVSTSGWQRDYCSAWHAVHAYVSRMCSAAFFERKGCLHCGKVSHHAIFVLGHTLFWCSYLLNSFSDWQETITGCWLPCELHRHANLLVAKMFLVAGFDSRLTAATVKVGSVHSINVLWDSVN